MGIRKLACETTTCTTGHTIGVISDCTVHTAVFFSWFGRLVSKAKRHEQADVVEPLVKMLEVISDEAGANKVKRAGRKILCTVLSSHEMFCCHIDANGLRS